MIEYCEEDFNIKALGSFYHQESTLFRVFAPDYKTMDVCVDGAVYPMLRRGFCFELRLLGDLILSRYYYIGDKKTRFADPFAYLSRDGKSYVLDSRRFISETITPAKVKAPVIYECSVHDFSFDETYPGKYKGKFLAFTESGLKGKNGKSIGLDYLKELGISHVQLMPVFDFNYDKSHYNWGYNPQAYNYVKDDYVFDKENPYAYVNELRMAVNACHKAGIRVVLDVVFNHVYRYKEFDLGKMLKGRCYRYKENGKLAEGTFCGNEIKSEDPFVRAYIIEMVERYLKLFDIDGIRMDLMGISDIKTVNEIFETLRQEKEDFMVYGEGWNMGDVLPEWRRASINNADQMDHVAMFNDYFRDTMIHYVSGNTLIDEDVCRCLRADPNYLSEEHSINYVECHDDYTFYDRMLIYKSEDEKAINRRRARLAMGLVMIAKGIPFIHSGEEFLRSKNGTKNSYNSGDLINRFNWDRRELMDDTVRYLKELIAIRQKYDCFCDEQAFIGFESYYGALIYRIDNLTIFINPGSEDILYDDGFERRIIFANERTRDSRGTLVDVSPYSIVICENE